MDRKPRWWRPVAAAFAAAILVVGFAGSALATPVTFYFEGEVFHADPALTGSVSLGDPFSGFYTFDD